MFAAPLLGAQVVDQAGGSQPLLSSWIFWVAAGVVLLVVVLLLRGRRRGVEESLPPLIFAPPPEGRESDDEEVLLDWPGGAGLPPPLELPTPPPPSSTIPPPSYTTPPPSYHASPAPYAAPQRVPEPPPLNDGLDEGATIQLLPGRLQVVAGEGEAREFRFARTPGPYTEVTIGRQSGEPPNHVRLAAPTVSRIHARMRFEAGRWTIENLSRTNPLVINGQVQDDDRRATLLRDGDRLEIGEFVLIFHAR